MQKKSEFAKFVRINSNSERAKMNLQFSYLMDRKGKTTLETFNG